MDKVFFRTGYNYDRVAVSDVSAVVPVGESLTVQSMTEDADLNVMMARFGLLQNIPSDRFRTPSFGDFHGVDDYQSAMQRVLDAEENFMELPASMRARFENNPQKLLEFLAVDSNRDEAVKLGLVNAKVVAPVVAPVVPTPEVVPSKA